MTAKKTTRKSKAAPKAKATPAPVEPTNPEPAAAVEPPVEATAPTEAAAEAPPPVEPVPVAEAPTPPVLKPARFEISADIPGMPGIVKLVVTEADLRIGDEDVRIVEEGIEAIARQLMASLVTNTRRTIERETHRSYRR